MTKTILTQADLELEIDSLGARITRFTQAGTEIMKSAKDGLHGYNGMVLAPWPNRIKDGKYVFENQEFYLEINEPDRNNALHGFAYKTQFEKTHSTTTEITLAAQLGKTDGYPFLIELEITYKLTPEGFSCLVKATNRSDSPAPFGIAFHPYYPADDATEVSIPAKTHLLADQQMIPTEKTPNTHGHFKFADVDFDDCFTDLQRTDGIANISFKNKNTELTLWQDEAFDFVMVYTTNEFDSTDGPASAIAIEAQSCAADAFNTEPPVLQPSESFRGSWGLTLSRR